MENLSSDFNTLITLISEALSLSDRLGRLDTSIALNTALVTLDGVGKASQSSAVDVRAGEHLP
ncbi:MAG TPA: hypothetical protein VF637_18650, partial [Sphingomicrobium sp.]